MNIILSALLLCLTPFQDLPKQIKSGQSLYITAIKSDTSKPDLSGESKLKKEFEKIKTFKLSPTISNADFVFLVYTEYDSYGAGVGGIVTQQTYLKGAMAFVVTSSVYKNHKDDLDKLKETAIWQGDVKSSNFKEASLSRLVKDFYKSYIEKK